MFLFWFAAATGTFLTVFLQKNGFQPAQVGVINAINSAVTICVTPLWGMLADKIRSNRKIFIFCIIVGASLWAFVPATARIVVGPILLMQILIPLSACFRNPAGSLMDAYVVQRCAREDVPYGNVRLWGSISFAVMAISLGAILPRTGVEITFYVYGFSYLPLIFIMLRMKDAPSGGPARKKVPLREMQFGRLFKNYYFVTYMIFAVFMNLPMNTMMTFLPYLIEMVGGDSAQLGIVAGYKALLEIPILLLMKPLRRRFPLSVAIILAGVLYAVEFSLYFRASSLTHILLIHTLHGIAGGFMIGAGANYVFTLAPEGLNSTAHTVSGAMGSAASIIGNLLGGALITVIGVRSFYLVGAGVIAVSIVYFAATLIIGSKVLKKPIPRST